MIEFTFLKESMLIKQLNQKSVIFVTIGVFWIKVLSFKYVCNDCHYLSVISINLNDIAIPK